MTGCCETWGLALPGWGVRVGPTVAATGDGVVLELWWVTGRAVGVGTRVIGPVRM
jgi:hypothetical protein